MDWTVFRCLAAILAYYVSRNAGVSLVDCHWASQHESCSPSLGRKEQVLMIVPQDTPILAAFSIGDG
jgi:hypothetical protein